MQVSRERLVRSVPKYLNYVLLRLDGGYVISEEEMRETFKYYRSFCEEAGLDFLTRPKFYEEMRMRGILTKTVWDRNLRRSVALRDLNDKDTVKQALEQWVDNSAVTGSVVEIDGERFQVIIKLVKLTNYDKPKQSGDNRSGGTVE